ncbi:MAG TPA: thioredoxin domain-containing protein [Polyangiaceae bacterium]|nr:thioredoxin domain-containing protein [Polyangiaceae bacterium]
MSRLWLIVTRIFLLVALATSAVLYSYYLAPLDSEFCSAQSGCETLRRSELAYFLGNRALSLPLFGMLAFAGAFALSLWTERRPTPQRHAPLCWVLLLGAAAAVGLIAYQTWVAQAYCWLCLIADGSSLLAACSAFVLHRLTVLEVTTQRLGVQRGAWLTLAVLATAAPLLWHVARPLPPVHAKIRALYQPDKINVVEFADLECPHCRRLQPMLKKVMEAYPDRVNFVRKHAPLPQHPHAERAAGAVICAESLARRGEAMVERLVAVELSDEAIDAAARELNLEQQAFHSCVAAPETIARMDEDLDLLREAGFEGLPTTYVGSQRFVGVRTEEAWRDAFDRAGRGEGHSGVPGPLFVTLLLGLCAAVLWIGRTADST